MVTVTVGASACWSVATSWSCGRPLNAAEQTRRPGDQLVEVGVLDGVLVLRARRPAADIDVLGHLQPTGLGKAGLGVGEPRLGQRRHRRSKTMCVSTGWSKAGANSLPAPMPRWRRIAADTLALRAEGRRFTVSFDEKALLTAQDNTFSDAGKVALWTKADSVTYFDTISIMPLK